MDVIPAKAGIALERQIAESIRPSRGLVSKRTIVVIPANAGIHFDCPHQWVGRRVEKAS
jgi:hypothetical protein